MVIVSTPARLHFGLLRFEQADGPSFGGLGMMIAEPRWTVQIEPATEWSVEGPDRERAAELVRRLWKELSPNHAQDAPPALRINVVSAIPLHHGFGGGTQLALAIAAGMRHLLGLPQATAVELALLTGRGKRSAVGTHGFLHGGLIWETGWQPGEPLGTLAARVRVPIPWRVLLVTPNSASGLSGQIELDAFSRLPPVAAATTARLIHLANQQNMPSAERGAFNEFSEAVYQYGRLAGECFASVQGGPYASPEIAKCVDAIRQLGVHGVGQSSWGPSLFAFTENDEHANWLADASQTKRIAPRGAIQITRADNVGAVISADV
jgi:beta-RFAP synthase